MDSANEPSDDAFEPAALDELRARLAERRRRPTSVSPPRTPGAPTNVNDVVADALATIHDVAARARVRTALGTVSPVDAEGPRLAQVFVHILLNAAQAISPERRAGAIEVSTGLDPAGRVVVEIRDDGIGIPEALHERIFDPLFSTKPRGATRGGTRGIGLAMCRNVVRALGGEVSVASEPGRGATFRVALPAAHAITAQAPRRGRVLILEPDPLLANALRRLLSRDHEITTHTDAHVALGELAAGVRFDAVLCDLATSGFSGTELHDRVAEISGDQAVRMVFVSGEAHAQRVRETVGVLANPRFEKPYDLAQIRAALRRTIA